MLDYLKSPGELLSVGILATVLAVALNLRVAEYCTRQMMPSVRLGTYRAGIVVFI